jgi:hypothetical protein
MKLVIGVMKDSSDQLQKYIDQNYHIEYIDEHVKGFGETLMKIKLTEEDVQKVRQRGYKISPRFWINIALMSAKESDKIVIADLQEEDYKKPFSKII